MNKSGDSTYLIRCSCGCNGLISRFIVDDKIHAEETLSMYHISLQTHELYVQNFFAQTQSGRINLKAIMWLDEIRKKVDMMGRIYFFRNPAGKGWISQVNPCEVVKAIDYMNNLLKPPPLMLLSGNEPTTSDGPIPHDFITGDWLKD